MDPETVPLSREDRAILALEQGPVRGHTCKVIRLSGNGDAPDARAIRDRIAARLPDVGLLHRRLGGTAHRPVWEYAPDLDINWHVVDATGPMALNPADLRAHIAEIFAERLDRSRPLWQFHVVGPLEDGGVALVWRVHHALADGTALVRMLEDVLWDDEPATPARTSSRQAAAQIPPARHPSLLGFAGRELARSHQPSPFDGLIGNAREVSFTSLPLAPLHDAARAHHRATVNDALLCVVAGGIRRWLERRHGPVGDIRVRVPVSLHAPGDATGNRDSYFHLTVPLHVMDPVARLEAISAETTLRKSEHDAETMDAVLCDLARISPRFARLAERVDLSPRSFALSVSNVPGPPGPVSVLGASASAIFPLAEIRKRHALRVAAISLDGVLHAGLCADPAIVEGVDELADDIATESQFLADAAGPVPSSPLS